MGSRIAVDCQQPVLNAENEGRTLAKGNAAGKLGVPFRLLAASREANGHQTFLGEKPGGRLDIGLSSSSGGSSASLISTPSAPVAVSNCARRLRAFSAAAVSGYSASIRRSRSSALAGWFSLPV